MCRLSVPSLVVLLAACVVCRAELPFLRNIAYVPRLDGLPQLNTATICDSLYRCSGCPDLETGAVTQSPRDGRAFSELNEGYLESLLPVVQPLSLVSRSRLRATFYLLRHALLTVPGDVVETGLFTGGSSILICRTLQDWDFCGHRRYWGYDSFQGLPDIADADKAGSGETGGAGAYAAGRDVVETNFRNTGVNLTSGLVILTPGWFNDTLPVARVKNIAFLRLDGDLFVSTWDGLINLYDKVVPGGLIYVDDYGSFNGCKIAVDLFRTQRQIYAPLHWVKEDDGKVEAVWWRKPLSSGRWRGGDEGGAWLRGSRGGRDMA